MSSTALPLELFRSVIEDISSNRDLCSLARVSHFIQREAEARIYRRIEAYGIKDITHICRRILASPRRGPYVFALALQEYRDCKHVLFAYWGLISRVLALMPNLRDLTTYLGIRSCATVFKEQHTFQLTSFKSHFLFDESLVRFFESQPQLRRLTIYHSVYTPEKNIALPLPSHILPHLIALDASSFITKLSLTIVNGRPVTYLSLNHFPKSEQSIEVLSRSAPTMKALYISETPLCNGMHEFPYTMPELEYLSRISVSSPAELKNWADTLSQFRKLNTIVVSCQGSGGLSSSAIVTQLSSACPSLRRILLYSFYSIYAERTLFQKRLDSVSGGWDHEKTTSGITAEWHSAFFRGLLDEVMRT